MRWKIAAVAGWLCVAVGLLLGAEKGRDGRFRSFVIEDERGRSRIMMDADDGEPSISLLNENAEVRCSLHLGKTGPMLSMSGQKNADRLMLWLDDDDGALPALTMFDDKDKPRVFVGVTKDEPPIKLYGTTKGDVAIPSP